MSSTPQQTATATDGGTRPYGHLSLPALAERIALSPGSPVLTEFHDHRTPFRLHGGPALRFAEFVAALCDTPQALTLAGHDHAALEHAYDLTIDKFLNLPDDTPGATQQRGNGPDCRNYFRGFVLLMRQWRDQRPSAGLLHEEAEAATILQAYVVRQFRLSCKEALRRSNPTRSRYAWRVDGGVIRVWMPAYSPGRQRRPWLEANVDRPDPTRPGEDERVQAIVDRLLGIPRRVPLGEDAMAGASTGRPEPRGLPATDPTFTVCGLARVVADEKVENLHRQRPAIQALGGSALRKLILCIFTELSAGRYEEKQVAERFGLSRPTLSRFAGMRPSSRQPEMQGCGMRSTACGAKASPV